MIKEKSHCSIIRNTDGLGHERWLGKCLGEKIRELEGGRGDRKIGVKEPLAMSI